MAYQRIHCTFCNGTGKCFTNYGPVTCLNCEGSGIVSLTPDQQNIITAQENEKKASKKVSEEKIAEEAKQAAIQNEILRVKFKNKAQRGLLFYFVILSLIIVGIYNSPSPIWTTIFVIVGIPFFRLFVYCILDILL